MDVRYSTSYHDPAEPVLDVVRLDPDGVPVATREQVTVFLLSWAAVDPNGTWDPAGLARVPGALTYTDEVSDLTWPEQEQGTYRLEGWPWWVEV